MDYDQYINHVNALVAEGKTSGPNQSEFLVQYTALNKKRMERVAKTVQINEDLKAALLTLDVDMIWLVLTEAWCGDAAQNIPVIAKIVQTNSRIALRLIWRDEHLDLMDQYLTNGGHSIPKLIALRAHDHKELGHWGPRPYYPQKMMEDFKAKGGNKEELIRDIQLWYANNQGALLQEEFRSLIEEWTKAATA